jgi:hypothetical protein
VGYNLELCSTIGECGFRYHRRELPVHSCFLIAVLAGLAGIAIARLAIDLILRALSSAYRATASGKLADIYPVVPLAPLPVDYHVFAFTFVVAGIVTLLFALAPALQASRPGVAVALRGELGGGVRPSRLRNFLLGSQVAVCLLLLIVAGILVRGVDQLRSLDTGLDLRGVFRVEARNPQARIDAPKLTLAIAHVAEQQTWAEPPAFAMSVPLAGRRVTTNRYRTRGPRRTNADTI